MILGVITDVHIYNEATLYHTIDYLKIHLAKQKPDVMLCLGDLFDKVTTCIKLAEKFKEEIHKVFPDWIVLYGNHDGEYPAKNEKPGWSHFLKVFPNAQSRVAFHGQAFVSVADLEHESNYETFLEKNVNPGDIVLSHGPFTKEILNKLSSMGVTLALNGHTHVLYTQMSDDKKLKQYSMPCFRIGGMNNEPACLTYVEIKNHKVTITCQETPLHSATKLTSEYLRRFEYPANIEGAETTDAHHWTLTPPLKEGKYSWQGGYSQLKHFEDGKLKWETSYGACHYNSTPLFKFKFNQQHLMLVSGTWGKGAGSKEFNSSVLIDAFTGEALLYLPVVGLTAEPFIDGNKMFIVGQWHEVISVDLVSKKIDWENTAFVSHHELEWRDNRLGGGWCINKPFVGEHVWVANLRGDLIGYDKTTGQRKFIHLAYIQKNAPVAYSPALLCGNVKSEYADKVKKIINIENKLINDITGEKIN